MKNRTRISPNEGIFIYDDGYVGECTNGLFFCLSTTDLALISHVWPLIGLTFGKSRAEDGPKWPIWVLQLNLKAIVWSGEGTDARMSLFGSCIVLYRRTIPNRE